MPMMAAGLLLTETPQLREINSSTNGPPLRGRPVRGRHVAKGFHCLTPPGPRLPHRRYGSSTVGYAGRTADGSCATHYRQQGSKAAFGTAARWDGTEDRVMIVNIDGSSAAT